MCVESSIEMLLSCAGLLGLLTMRDQLVAATCVQTLLRLFQVIFRNAIVGDGAVSLYLFPFPPFGDDYVAGVMTDVDDVAEVAVGVVV